MILPKSRSSGMPRTEGETKDGGVRVEGLMRRPEWLLAAVVLIALVPFLTKPFNIDDPLFIWIARHIQSHPGDPYGFKVNWYNYAWPMWDTTMNPPLACYYLSVVGSVLGWSEPAVHAAFILPAVLAIVGVWRLAGRLCSRPIHAAVLTLFTPVFLVSATTLMCDVMMLTFWVWALVLWLEGAERNSAGRIAAAACLMAFAFLTKYFAACLIPLVVLWSLVRKQPVKQWLGWLAVPVLAIVAYQLGTRLRYGQGLLTGAASYASLGHSLTSGGIPRVVLSGLAFTGGCLAPLTFFAPLLWRGRVMLIGGTACLIITGALCYLAKGSFPTSLLTPLEAAQLLFWAIGGIGLLALALADLWQRRDADSLLLGCWAGGTFVFAAYCNWVINSRSILPMAVPVAILVMRRLEARVKERPEWSRWALAASGLVGGALAVWVAVADYLFAQATQTAAHAICSNYRHDGHRLWFQGHWGFQYYMEQGGATALDIQHLQLAEGDCIAMPDRNTNVKPLKGAVAELATITVPDGGGGMSTMYIPAGSGFYASVFGPLPFAFGSEPEQQVWLFAYDPEGKLQGTNAAAGH